MEANELSRSHFDTTKVTLPIELVQQVLLELAQLGHDNALSAALVSKTFCQKLLKLSYEDCQVHWTRLDDFQRVLESMDYQQLGRLTIDMRLKDEENQSSNRPAETVARCSLKVENLCLVDAYIRMDLQECPRFSKTLTDSVRDLTIIEGGKRTKSDILHWAYCQLGSFRQSDKRNTTDFQHCKTLWIEPKEGYDGSKTWDPKLIYNFPSLEYVYFYFNFKFVSDFMFERLAGLTGIPNNARVAIIIQRSHSKEALEALEKLKKTINSDLSRIEDPVRRMMERAAVLTIDCDNGETVSNTPEGRAKINAALEAEWCAKEAKRRTAPPLE